MHSPASFSSSPTRSASKATGSIKDRWLRRRGRRAGPIDGGSRRAPPPLVPQPWRATSSDGTRDWQVQAACHVALDCGCLQGSSAKSDVAVGAQQIEGGVWDPGAGQLGVVGEVVGNGVDATEAAQAQGVLRGRGLADREQAEVRIVELLEQVLDAAVCPELQPQPGKAIAGAGRAVGHTRLRVR